MPRSVRASLMNCRLIAPRMSASVNRRSMALRSTAFFATFLAVIALPHMPDWGTVQAQAARSIWSGVYTEPQMRRGEELYATRCSRCHGTDLAGLSWEQLRQVMPEAARSALHLDRTPELTGPHLQPELRQTFTGRSA